MKAALLHGLLEMIERDAVSLWWLGGQPAAPVDAETMNAGGVRELMAQLRGGQTSRRSWLLDITTDLGVPCIASLSCNADGHGLACGFSARLRHGDALVAAILEMCQMEMAIHIVQLKRRQQGDSALNEADLQHLARCHDLNTWQCAQLHPIDDARRTTTANILGTPLSEIRTDDDVVGLLAEHLAALDVEALALDISRRELGIPAVRMLAPGLQPMPSDVITRRLAAKIDVTGGGAGLTNGIPLI